MAKPIIPTPILKDKEAEKFLEEVDNPKMKKASKDEVVKAKKVFEAITKNHRLPKYAL